ncbi:MAG: hypothetical protein V4497_06010 [Bacteroidota bacterium]
MDEIIFYSKYNFFFGNYTEYNNSYEIINIQFPEAIFDWKEPSQKQLKDLEENLIFWKKKSKIVFTMNDLKNHYDENNKFLELFKLVHRYADGVIHLGKYSYENYKCLFSFYCKHTVIYHPLYDTLLENFENNDFQKKFQINLDKKYVVAVIGAIRSFEEARLMLKVFKNIPRKNKILVVPQMIQFTNLPSFWPYRYRRLYKIVAEFVFCFPLLKKQYFFGFKFVEYSLIVDLLKRTDLMIIPRIRNLNSGNLFLGLTFDIPMIIPKVGNLTEIATLFDFPTLNLKEMNMKEVISHQVGLKSNYLVQKGDYIEKKKKFSASIIAKQYDDFFNIMINQ